MASTGVFITALVFVLQFSYSPAANASEKLVFPPLPKSPPPKSETEYDDQGLQPLINVANSFIRTVKDDGLPYSLINEELQKAFKGSDTTPSPASTRRRLLVFGIENEFINEFIEFEKEFIIVFGIGIALAILLLVIGVVFFCCRICGYCGGSLVYEREDNHENLKRWLMILFLVIFLALATVGCVCAFVTNGRMSDSIGKFDDTFSDAIDDIYGFVNSTVDELNFVVGNQYGIASDRIFDDIENVGQTLGEPIVTAFQPFVDKAVNSSLNMANTVDEVRASLFDVNRTVSSLVAVGKNLQTQLEGVNQELQSLRQTCTAKGFPISKFCSDYLPGPIKLDANFSQVPDISGELAQVDDVLQVDLRAEVEEGKRMFEEIPEQVQNDTNVAVETVRADADQFQADIQKVVSDVNTSAYEVLDDSLGLRSVQKDVSNYVEIAERYDKYRFAVGVSLGVMILLVIFIATTGILIGEMNRKSDVMPTERSRGSNCGGQCLMISAVLVCVFGFFLLILAAICFAIGANVKVLCDPAENLEFWENTLDNGDGFGYYFLGQQIFNNESFPLEISGVLRSCDENVAIYKALRLKEKPEANIRERFDIEKQIPALRENTENLKVNVDNVELLPVSAENALRDFNETGVEDIDFAEYSDEINKQLVNFDLTTVVANLTSLANELDQGNESDLANQTRGIAASIGRIQTTVVLPGTARKDELDVQVKNLERNARGIQTSVGELLDLVDELEVFLHGNGSRMINESVIEFTDRIVGYVTDFADAAVGWIENDIGRCKNVRVVYDAAVVTLCRFTLDGLNGFWFSVGWSVFFMFFIMIIAINLAYHYRKLNHNAGFDSDYGTPNDFAMKQKSSKKESWVAEENIFYPRGVSTKGDTTEM
ncbi:prominin-1-A-like isoform X2 [Oscarella lobularis]|uniref:prominin-1-A-like isoform X2 n=2 Tax=Oscarella lobularis TaxID=121494 RepID=UPI003313F623